MRIKRIEAIGVSLPIDGELRHSYGTHVTFTRTIVRVHTDSGLVGIAETAASPSRVEAIGEAAVGFSPWELERIKARIQQRFYWSREPLVAAAIEMACIDLQARSADVPAYDLLGGKVRASLDMAAYLFFSHGGAIGQIKTPDEMASYAEALAAAHGYRTFKLKAGVLDPRLELEVLGALRDRLGPDVRLRIDPNAAWHPATASTLAPTLEKIGIEYLEDPAPGIEGMAAVRSRTRLPLATNMIVVDFPQLIPAVRRDAIDVILADPWYWGGAHPTKTLATLCEAAGLSIGMHSGIELGIGMAAMAHIGVTIPNLLLASDAHYHHLLDDVIQGPMLLPVNGTLKPPEGPGWGVEIDATKLELYHQAYLDQDSAGVYEDGIGSNDPDPTRPGWFPIMPAW